MDIKEFISNFADQFDDLEVSALTPETEFKQLDDWNSLVALSVIAMVDEEYDVTLKGNDITGTLYYTDEGSLVETWDAGYFIAIDMSDNDYTDYATVLAGMDPSMGSGLADIKGDPDHEIIAKVTDKNLQKFVVVATDSSGNSLTQEFDLSLLNFVKN